MKKRTWQHRRKNFRQKIWRLLRKGLASIADGTVRRGSSSSLFSRNVSSVSSKSLLLLFVLRVLRGTLLTNSSSSKYVECICSTTTYYVREGSLSWSLEKVASAAGMEAEAAAFSNDNIHGRRKSERALNFYVNLSLEKYKKGHGFAKETIIIHPSYCNINESMN